MVFFKHIPTFLNTDSVRGYMMGNCMYAPRPGDRWEADGLRYNIWICQNLSQAIGVALKTQRDFLRGYDDVWHYKIYSVAGQSIYIWEVPNDFTRQGDLWVTNTPDKIIVEKEIADVFVPLDEIVHARCKDNAEKLMQIRRGESLEK
jgi:hypothetical protein